MIRVQIPAWSDHWMKGDRYGDVLKIDLLVVAGKEIDRASVLLDKSKKVARFDMVDLTVLDAG